MSTRIIFIRSLLLVSGITVSTISSVQAQESSDALIAKGKELYFEQVSCWVCHGDEAEGRIGPTIAYGPTPAQIQEQLYSNPQMAIIVSTMSPDDDDLLALSTYLSSLSGKTINSDQMVAWQTELDETQRQNAALTADAEYVITERDLAVIQVQNFDTVLSDWQRKAKAGSLRGEYQSTVIAEFEPGEQVFFPESGGLYFYENIGPSTTRSGIQVAERTNEVQVVVGDASAHEVITSKKMPTELRGIIHTTVMSPDGRYVYIVGSPTPGGAPEVRGQRVTASRGTASLLKVDALTLNPVKQISVGGRVHHGQIFDEKHILFDTFVRDPNGLDVFLYDTETDSVAGGVRCPDLGGVCYTAHNDGEFIYILMAPPPVQGGNAGNQQIAMGMFTGSRPFWVAKVDPETWEVVREYPYRGYRGDWVVIDAKSEHLYVPTVSTVVNKINMETGDIVWSAPTGVGPYGGTLNADESEIWVTNKGEASGQMGRTITVFDAETGTGLETVFSGYQVDHVLLAPNGKEIWATSNGEGRVYVFDAESREQIEVMDMPNNGDPHGLVWVKYDDEGNSMVVRDQGGFHNGINPAEGSPLLD
jgi:DNA-binding beta-propeller fold protein YncE/mono/diheme cytochrome c family protein